MNKFSFQKCLCILMMNACSCFCLVLNGQDSTIHCNPSPEKSGGFWYRYQTFDPYSTLSYQSFGVIIKRDTVGCDIRYVFIDARYGPGHPPYDTLKIYFNTCNPALSRYDYIQHWDEAFFKKIPFFSAKLYKVDTMQFAYEGSNYTLQKYKAVLPDSQKITIYFSDSMGIIKQYASFRSRSNGCFEMEWRNSKCPQLDFINAHLKALFHRNDFHERYDDGPRTIRGEILDPKKFRKTKKRYKKMGLI